MSRYILDTDHVSLILCNHPQVVTKAQQHQTHITIITVQELFNGWVGKINDPSNIHDLPILYTKLWTTVRFLQTVEILNFTPEADNCLKFLLKGNPHLRKNRLQKDIRIAAIALSLNAIVVTRNQRDFKQIPQINIVDWTLE